jgi:hypothetical protein
MKSIHMATILVALVTSACSAATVSPSAVPSSTPAAKVSPTAALTAVPTVSPPGPLEGIWTTAEITCDQQAAAIHAAGFTDAQITASGWPCLAPLYERLRFLGDRMGQFEKTGGGFELGSQDTFKLTDDHTLVLDEIGYEGVTTLGFTLVGNVLTFTSLNSDAAELGASIFDQIAGPAIFLSAPFIKEP